MSEADEGAAPAKRGAKRKRAKRDAETQGAEPAGGERRPAFARSFPRTPELDALVHAFEAGDYRMVRADAADLAQRADDPAVQRAAAMLRARTEADPLARGLLALTLVLLVVLTTYWAVQRVPDAAPSPSPPPQVERVR